MVESVDEVLREMARDSRYTRADVIAGIEGVLDRFPDEVPFVVDALHAGKIDGRFYTGPCACLVGTAAKGRGFPAVYQGLGHERDKLEAFIGYRTDFGNPEEIWVHYIRPGHTPANNPVAKQTLDWIQAWQQRKQTTGNPSEPGHPNNPRSDYGE